jgi:hypothetical protein
MFKNHGRLENPTKLEGVQDLAVAWAVAARTSGRSSADAVGPSSVARWADIRESDDSSEASEASNRTGAGTKGYHYEDHDVAG